MASHTENQDIGPQQQRHQDTLLNALLTDALYKATSAPDSRTPTVPQGLAVGEGEDRGDETRASLIHRIDSVLDLMNDDDELEL
jgi:hypothetical protein